MTTVDERRRIAEQFAAIGERRREALGSAEAELNAIVERTPAAPEAGLNLKDIAALDAVSRPRCTRATAFAAPARAGASRTLLASANAPDAGDRLGEYAPGDVQNAVR